MKNIKSIIIALGLFLAATINAQTTWALSWEWNQPEPEASNPELETRLVGQKVGGQPVTLGSVTAKTEITAEITAGVWEFWVVNVVKAPDGSDLLSDPSNKVRVVVQGKPGAPINFRKKITIIIE